MKNKILLLLSGIIFSLSNNAQACSVSITVSPSNAVCSGTAVTFNAAVIVTCTTFYTDWYVNGNLVFSTSSTAPVPFVLNSPLNGDQIYCQVACNPFDICYSNTIVMTVLPSVTPSVSIIGIPDTVCLPGCTTFNATYVNGGSPDFTWYVDGVPDLSSSVSSFIYCPLTQGTHIVFCVMNSSAVCANPNQVNSNTFMVTALICTGNEEKTPVSSLLISPNPGEGIFSISFKSSPHCAYLTAADAFGEIIYEQKVSEAKAEIDLSTRPAGIYFITLRDERNNSVTRKLVKMEK